MHQHDADCTHGTELRTPPIPAQATAEAQPAGVAVHPGGGPQAASPQADSPHPGAYPGAAQPRFEAPEESRAYRFLMALWTKPSWLAPLAVLGCIMAAFGYVLANDPTDQQRDPLGPCAFKALTGLDCPGCGGTRMVWYLLNANPFQAARHHLVAFVAVPVVAYVYIAWASRRIFNHRLPTLRIPPTVWGSYLVVWLIYSVLRNLPWAPFNFFFVS